jgi:hypothetical protein
MSNEAKNQQGQPCFVPEYVHYRTGKIMRATDYGYKAWYFGSKSVKS